MKSRQFNPSTKFEQHHARSIFSVDWSRNFDGVTESYIATGGADDAIRLIEASPSPAAANDCGEKDTTVADTTTLANAATPRTEFGSGGLQYKVLPPHLQAHDGDINCVKWVLFFFVVVNKDAVHCVVIVARPCCLIGGTPHMQTFWLPVATTGKWKCGVSQRCTNNNNVHRCDKEQWISGNVLTFLKKDCCLQSKANRIKKTIPMPLSFPSLAVVAMDN